jgi:autotransporter passenger strand-loop-strand repeat protein
MSTMNLATGLNSSGILQTSGGSLDANWQVTGAINPLSSPNAYVVAPDDADWFSGDNSFAGWAANGPSSSWIAANPNDANGNGPMTFTLTFYLSDASSVSIINGEWNIDDNGTLSLNGHLLSSSSQSANGSQDYQTLETFSTVPSDFVSGLNTLVIQETTTDDHLEAARLQGQLIIGPSTVISGQTYNVSSGQTDTGDTVEYGGTLNVLSGGTISKTTDKGTVYVSSGGTEIGTVVNGYAQEYVLDGGSALGTVVDSGGNEIVSAGGTAIGTVVNSGGDQYDNGVALNTIVNGAQFLSGIASGTVVNGTQFLYDYATASGTVVNGNQYVDDFATASGTAVNGTQYVDDYGIADGTVVNGAQYLYDYATASGTTVNGNQYVYDFATASGTVVNRGGIQRVDGIATSTTVESGGTEIVNAGGTAIATTLLSGGTLLASGGTADVAAAIKGGSILICNGTVDIQQASADNVTFRSGGIGGVELDIANAYTGEVSGFGSDSSQFIDFTHVNSAGATVSYTPKSSDSGILTVTSGGHTLASIHMIGHYTTADFHPGNDGSGNLIITDPPVVEQKPGNAPATIAAGEVLEVKVSDSGKTTFAGLTGALWLDKPSTFTGKVVDFGPLDSIDLPGIPYGTHTTLGYLENRGNTGGVLTVRNGTHSAKIALLGNYIAGSFVTAADGHGGTLITEATQQPLLAKPHP